MKKFVAMSAVAALAVMGYAADAEVEALKKELSTLKEQVKEIKIHDAADNVKFSVDMRSAVDAIEYTRASGKTDGNANLMTNRLQLGMAAQPAENLTFNGLLSYNKAFGAASQNFNNAQIAGAPQRGYGFDTFDWVINENLTDNSLKVKEASFFYYGDLGVPFTVSVGRRPSTDGFLANHREGASRAKSPLGHSINVEYDGASFLLKELTDFGTSFKICAGRGLTNARSRFNMDGGLTSYGDYSEDKGAIDSVDMYGFILVPYDDGQYKVTYMNYHATNLPGFSMVDTNYMGGIMQAASAYQTAAGTYMADTTNAIAYTDMKRAGDTYNNALSASSNTGMLQFTDDGSQTNTAMGYQMNNQGGLAMESLGDFDAWALSFQASGIGDGIADFLDDTTFFISYASSTTTPNNDGMTLNMDAMFAYMQGYGKTLTEAFSDFMGMSATQQAGMMRESGMLGSTDSETGTSIWAGLVIPAVFTDDGKIGFEYNHGDQYWRSFTYGEDTMTGSKLATRGSATEVYYNQPLVGDYLKMQLRYTAIAYEYTGSQGFFGDEGTPYKIDDAKAMGMDPIESSTDMRFSITYNY